MEAKDTREKIDIVELNAGDQNTVSRIEQLRAEIDVIVKEIEGYYHMMNSLFREIIRWLKVEKVVPGKGTEQKTKYLVSTDMMIVIQRCFNSW